MSTSCKYFKALLLATMLSFAAVPFASADESTANLPEPAAPQHAVYSDGRVEVFIGTPRVSDYQIGDSIPVRIVFLLEPDAMFKAQQEAKKSTDTTPSVVPVVTTPAATDDKAMPVAPGMLDVPALDLSGIRMGVLSDQPSDVEPLVPGKVDEYIRPDGKKMVVALFYVTTYVTTTQKQVDIAANFMYAVSKRPDGQPDFQSATTPTMTVGITRSATENQTLLIEGDLSAKESPKAPAAIWALVGSFPLAIPMVVALGIIVFRRLTRKILPTHNELTWITLDGIIAGAGENFTIEHYRRIFYALRENLDVLGKDTTQTLETLSKRPGLDFEAVSEVFNRETMFFDPRTTIGRPQHEKLLNAIGKLIPRQ